MKDKELRKLLEEKGIIELAYPLDPIHTSQGFEANHVAALLIRVKELEHSNRDRIEAGHIAFEELYKANAKIQDLEDKFDAINKHYGISVEKQEAQYVVKDDS